MQRSSLRVRQESFGIYSFELWLVQWCSTKHLGYKLQYILTSFAFLILQKLFILFFSPSIASLFFLQLRSLLHTLSSCFPWTQLPENNWCFTGQWLFEKLKWASHRSLAKFSNFQITCEASEFSKHRGKFSSLVLQKNRGKVIKAPVKPQNSVENIMEICRFCLFHV